MYASFENIEVQKKDSNHWLIKKKQKYQNDRGKSIDLNF